MTKRLPINNELKNSFDLRKIAPAIQSGGTPLYNPTGGGMLRSSIGIVEDCTLPGPYVGGVNGQISIWVESTTSYNLVLQRDKGDNRIVIVAFNYSAGAPHCTLNGVAGTYYGTSPAGFGVRVYYWLDADLPVLAGTYIVHTDCGAALTWCWSQAIELYSAAQTNPFGVLAGSATLSLTADSVAGNLVVDFISIDPGGEIVPDAGQTERYEEHSAFGGWSATIACSTKNAVGVATVMDWDAGTVVSHTGLSVRGTALIPDKLTELIVPCGSIVSSSDGVVEIDFLIPGGGLADLGSTAETVGGAHDDGVATTASRSDHKHEITNPKLDALATPDDNATLNANTTNHGLLIKAVAPAAGLTTIPAIETGETVYKLKALFDNTNPEPDGVAAPGTALIAARRDHVHVGGGAGHIIQDDGADENARAHLNFTGAGVTVSDDVGNDATIVDIHANNMYIDQSGGTADTYGVLLGARDGANKEFTVSQGVYSTGTLSVYLNGQLQTQGTAEDWHEHDPATGVFHFTVAPEATDEITVVYGYLAVGGYVAGVLVTTVGDPGSDTNIPSEQAVREALTALGITLTPLDGWTAASGTWTYASASTFTISGDVTAIYKKGLKLKWTNASGSNPRYGTVKIDSTYGAPNTTVTIITNTDFVIADDAISLNYYSWMEMPTGWPQFFNFAPTFTNFTVGNATVVFRFRPIQSYMFVEFYITLGNSSAMGTGMYSNLPANGVHYSIDTYYFEDNATAGFLGVLSVVTDKAYFYKYTVSGTSIDQGNCAATVPFTWTTGDFLRGKFTYRW
jgi:hypothetical protein